MTNIQKRDIVLQDLAKHNEELIRQARIKINKSIAPDKSDPLELVSDVLYSIIKKLDNTKEINKFYKMAVDGMLFSYVAKSVDRNARFINTPFGRKKLALKKRIQVGPHHQIEIEDEELPDELQDKICFIQKCMEEPEARRIFGPRYGLVITLLNEYKEDGCTYQKLSDKYDIPLGSISWTFKYIKTKIREEWQKEINPN